MAGFSDPPPLKGLPLLVQCGDYLFLPADARLEAEFGNPGDSPGDQESSQKKQKGPQKEGERKAFPSKIVMQRNQLVIVDGKAYRSSEKKKVENSLKDIHGRVSFPSFLNFSCSLR